MATICVPNRVVVTCVDSGVASRSNVRCMRPVRPEPEPCDYLVCVKEPTVTDLIGGMGLASVVGTIAVAGGNADDLVWDVLNRLTGPGSVEYWKGLFSEDPETIPGVVAESWDDRSGVANSGREGASGGRRVITPFGRGWARGEIDRMYNRAMGDGGVAQVGVAGIEGESEAASCGEKRFPGEDDWWVPKGPGQEPPRDPTDGYCEWTKCTEDDERLGVWGTPGSTDVPDPSLDLALPIPQPDVYNDSRWHQKNGGGLNDNGRGARKFSGRVFVGSGLPNIAGVGGDFSIHAHSNLGGVD